MGFMRQTMDPFLFCVHHLDLYPEGNEAMGPDAPLAGRHIGSDFDEANDWKMYHGAEVPGFPAHPHRGFETITVVLDGLVDHFDSGGSTGRYGFGDVQWMTAGSGLMHSEMFPLVNRNGPNRLDLFQIWLNLPAKDKMAEPGYEMLWADQVPHVPFEGGDVRVVAGPWFDVQAPPPPKASWAHDPDNEVALYIINLDEGGSVELPVASGSVNRMMYHIDGHEAEVENLDVAILSDHDIARFQISMNNSVLMRVLDRIRDFANQFRSLARKQRTAFDFLRKTLTLDITHRKIMLTVNIANFVDWDDRRMLESSGCFRFALKTPDVLSRCQLPLKNHLYRDNAI